MVLNLDIGSELIVRAFLSVFFIFCRMTNFLSSWQKFGQDDKKLVAMTIGIVAWPIFCHCDKNLVTMTIGNVAWPIFCHDDKKLVLRHWLNPDDHQQGYLYIDQTLIIIKYAWTLIKSQSTFIKDAWTFDPCPSILDDYYWDFIHVQTSLMNSEIWSMSKHPWLCWLGFYQRPSIHNDDYCNFIHVEASFDHLIHVQAFLMVNTAI